ncbi:hypothetical protein EV645_7817 [Kribbella rubisoli]|uniref:Uncharacterized protein n=1 Tax=Kribbella rubisoli TaxID=3075929 RepID=A0A4Q7VY99_9ACTN|nr:hypothetical protein [Kribbella rubisoli]RZU01721.1 hypothetical protein EV645_7817 [Kribbella rubisoli]
MRRLLRCAAVLAAGLGFGLAFAAPAGAAAPQPIAPSELSKATSAAHSSSAVQLLAKVPGAAGKAAAIIGSDSHAVYALNPAFVRDASAPVATFWYAATAASKGGQALTVFTAPDSSGVWQPVNVASGNTEARMAGAADGALLFTEPQLGAWYALSAGQVRPLNPSAVKSIGTKPIAVTAYQKLVSQRYSDKLPGSTYNESGMAGGYDTAAAVKAPRSRSEYLVPVVAASGVLALALLLVVRRKMTYND